jgi:GNAT superfamily N-acetyltransferase
MAALSVASLLPSLARLSLRRPRATGATTRSGRSHDRPPTKRCVGFVAVSRLDNAEDGTGALFIEELFVVEAQRGQRIGRCLLAHAMGQQDPATVPRAALVVRVAKQQAPALRLYGHARFAVVESAPPYVDPRTEEHVEIVPAKNQQYREAPIGYSDCALRGPDAKGRMRVAQTGVFMDAAPVAARRFTKIEPGLMEEAAGYHMADEGDKEDVYGIVHAANLGVYGAYVYE